MWRNRFDAQGRSQKVPLEKRHVLLQPGNSSFWRDALKQFRKYPLSISESDAPSYNKNDGAIEPAETVVRIDKKEEVGSGRPSNLYCAAPG